MADINQTAEWVTARLTELGSATNGGLNTLITDENIGNYNAKNVNGVVAIENGGTGASDPADALANLGGVATGSLAAVATSGAFNDLLNKPTIPTISDTYDSGSSDGMSGVAVASAIDASTDAILNGVIAKPFSTAVDYYEGDYCIYNDLLYVFEYDKPAGAWSNTGVAQVKLADDVEKNTADINYLEKNVYKSGGIGWADFADASYPYGVQTGYWNATTGSATGNAAYVRTPRETGGYIDWSNIERFTVTAPSPYCVHVTEYTKSGHEFVRAYGIADTDSEAATRSVTVEVTPTNYYLFTFGKTANFINVINQEPSLLDGFMLNTYVNRIDALDESLIDIVADEYSSSATYAVGDYCVYDGGLYQCTTAITTAEGWNAAHWTAVKLSDRIPRSVDDGVLILGEDGTVSSTSNIHTIKAFGNEYELVPEAFDNFSEEYDPTKTYHYGDLVIYERVLYTCILSITTPEPWNSVKWEQTTVNGALANKAEIDGYYESMTVGNAEQLVSNQFVEDKLPYNFRTTGGTHDVGNREYEKVVGGSLVWNQLVQNGDFSDGTSYWVAHQGTIAVADNKCTLTLSNNNATGGICQALGLGIVGHKMFLQMSVTPTKDTVCAFDVSGGNTLARQISAPANVSTEVCGVLEVTTATGGAYFYCNRNSALDNGDTCAFENVFAIDLTAMFGPTIANYVYELETATTGVGVAWVKKLFPKDYYEYNAGGFQHVKTSAHETVGLNQWDEEWITTGYFDATGAWVADTRYVASKNPIPVFPNTEYYFHNGGAGQGNIRLFDEIVPSGKSAEEHFIGSLSNNAGKTFVTPANCKCIHFNMNGTYGNIYGNDVCINLSHNGTHNGEYEPYKKHVYELTPTELMGVFKLDSANQLYCDGDIYSHDGITRRYRVYTFTGEENWRASGTVANAFSMTFNEAKRHAGSYNYENYSLMSNGYAEFGRINDASPDKSFALNSSAHGANKLFVKDSAYTDASAFAASMAGVMLVYELATPTTESALPFINPQVCDDWGTERYVDYGVEQGTRDVAIPVGHTTEYTANLVDKLNKLPSASASGDGQYIIQQTNLKMTLIPYSPATGLPLPPSADGTYTLKATVTDGVVTYTWV